MIVESTSYPGTTQEQVLAWLEDGSALIAGADFHLGYSPERLWDGQASSRIAAVLLAAHGAAVGSGGSPPTAPLS